MPRPNLKKGDPKTKEIAKKGNKQSAEVRHMQAEIKKLLASGDIDQLQKQALKNFAEMLYDKDKQVRAFATKEIAKYLFATKREVTKFPAINIHCNFIGIKDDG